MLKLMEKLPESTKFQYKFYADDLVIICPHKSTQLIIKTLREVS